MVTSVHAVLRQVAVPPHQVVQHPPTDIHSIINHSPPTPTRQPYSYPVNVFIHMQRIHPHHCSAFIHIIAVHSSTPLQCIHCPPPYGYISKGSVPPLEVPAAVDDLAADRVHVQSLHCRVAAVDRFQEGPAHRCQLVSAGMTVRFWFFREEFQHVLRDVSEGDFCPLHPLLPVALGVFG